MSDHFFRKGINRVSEVGDCWEKTWLRLGVLVGIAVVSNIVIVVMSDGRSTVLSSALTSANWRICCHDVNRKRRSEIEEVRG